MSLLKSYNKKNQMSKEEKSLEQDYKNYCEMTGKLSNKELNRKYEKEYLERW